MISLDFEAILILQDKIMITAYYEISYFEINFDRKSTKYL